MTTGPRENTDENSVMYYIHGMKYNATSRANRVTCYMHGRMSIIINKSILMHGRN